MSENAVKLSESIEDYLESVLILSNELPHVRSVDVATFLGFSRPSVSHAVKMLQDQGYLEKTSNKYLVLTPMGMAVADETYKRHQFFEQLLVDLGVSVDIARKDACRIEHILSQESFDALEKFYKQVREQLDFPPQS